MRKFLFVFTAVLSFVITSAQTATDPIFAKRLDDYMRLTRELKFDEIMEYTHPRIFTLAPKEQLVETFKQAFDNELMRIVFDSTAITHVSADFKSKDVLYRKVEYWMAIRVIYKDTTAVNDESFVTTMVGAFQKAFPGGTVVFNTKTKNFDVSAPSLMIAIKDDAKTPWKFLGYQKNGDLLRRLYPQEVIDNFKLL
jgi:hypothetical protein